MTDAPHAPPACPQVLYVEDDVFSARVMAALFEFRPHLRLHVAPDGAQAIALAARLRRPPQLLLLDQRLPDCRGTELLPLLRARFSWHDVPAIAVTAESDLDAAAAGYVEMWQKPLDLKAVLARLDGLLPRAAEPPPSRGLFTPRGGADQPRRFAASAGIS